MIGPVIGVCLFVYAKAHLNGGNLHLYTGAAVVLVLALMPGGITGMAEKWWNKARARRPSPTDMSSGEHAEQKDEARP